MGCLFSSCTSADFEKAEAFLGHIYDTAMPIAQQILAQQGFDKELAVVKKIDNYVNDVKDIPRIVTQFQTAINAAGTARDGVAAVDTLLTQTIQLLDEFTPKEMNVASKIGPILAKIHETKDDPSLPAAEGIVRRIKAAKEAGRINDVPTVAQLMLDVIDLIQAIAKKHLATFWPENTDRVLDNVQLGVQIFVKGLYNQNLTYQRGDALSQV